MFGWRVYTTVIMDGSSKFVNREIVGLMDMITRRRIGKSRCRKLDKNYPTMRVIKRFTSIERYHNARREIERFYPGVCNFDVKFNND